MGVPIHNVTTEEVVTLIAQWIEEKTPHQIATVNPEFLMRARWDTAFRATLQQVSLCVPDGIGILWAAKMRRRLLRERVAGSDLVPRLTAEAAQRGWRVYFLGAAPGVAEKAASVLKKHHPSLCVAGCYAGSPSPEEEEQITTLIRNTQADLVFVAYGAPQQDLWLARNLSQTGASVGIGIGGAFDFIAGVSQRAPIWIQKLGLEWLYRLIKEPWRWRRQLVLPKFAILVLLGRDNPR